LRLHRSAAQERNAKLCAEDAGGSVRLRAAQVRAGRDRARGWTLTKIEASAEPDVTVVVVNYNGGDHLRACLASLARQTHANFETILVDNASTDGSLDRLAERPERLTVLRQTANLGFAAANNIGARAGRGRWLALLNPDAIADPRWIEEMLAAVARRPTHRLVACRQLMTDRPDLLDGAGDCYLAFGFAWRGGFGRAASATPPEGECFAPCGAAAFYPRERFLDLGGFEDSYFCYHEDVDLGFRMRLAGERCQFAPAACVRHAGSAITGRASRFSIYHGVRNGVWTYVRNMPAPLIALTLPVWTLGSLALLVRGAVIGRFAATLHGFSDALVQMPRVLGARTAVQSRRRVSLATLAASFSWNPLDFIRRRPFVRPFKP
jgi:N-acetylglucosaminyl-diphospho-decaprenol L-rhamnosyltransferase